MVRHVPVVGVLMIVHGALSLGTSLLLTILGPMVADSIQPPPSADAIPVDFGSFAVVTYLILGIPLAISAMLSLLGGIWAFRYRGKGLVFGALIVNVICGGGCYCLATAVPLLIYGLVVMLNRDVGHSFDLGAKGWTGDQIRDAWDRARLAPSQHPWPPVR